MTINIIPPTMRARHHETGEWHVLYLSAMASIFWPRKIYYSICDDNVFNWADLNDFDCFEGVR